MDFIQSIRGRSFGLKLMLVGVLAMALSIPAIFIHGLVFERSSRAEEVRRDIYGLTGGEQIISGPVILVPGSVETGKKTRDGDPIVENRYYAFTPKTLSVDTAVAASQRHRSIYSATVYDADIAMEGVFGNLKAPQTGDGALTLFWDQAVLAVKFNDNSALKGVRDSLTLEINGRRVSSSFEPGIQLSLTGDSDMSGLSAPGVSLPFPITAPDKTLTFKLTLPLSGGGALYFAPVGEETRVAMRANWPDPSFQGAYLPDRREITEDGFSAEWRIPYIARNLPRSFAVEDELAILDAGKVFGAEFIDAASPYKSVNRALKYALMFLGVVFLTFFIFEIMTGSRAHPAQYILLGLAQVIFYLLVLAFSEHIGFEPAFIGSAVATVSLSGAYAATVFHSKLRGLIAFAAFSGAYGLIYLLMKSEDYALLIGSVTAFGAIALTMFVTRNLDWYGAREQPQG